MNTRTMLLCMVLGMAAACTSERPAETATAPAVAPEASALDSTPQVGDQAPDLTLSDQQGNRVTLSDARGLPLVLVFYRGHW